MEGGIMMGSSHYLITKAHIYPQNSELSDPSDCRYELEFGAWFWCHDNNNTILVKSSNPQRPRPQTKKYDIETGEDLKGE